MLMSDEELDFVIDTMEMLTPNIEDFSWGPTYEIAKQEKQAALKLLKRERHNRDTHIGVPADKEQAEAMLRLAHFYLQQNGHLD